MTEPVASAITPVREAMHRGIITCPPQTPLSEAATLMSQSGVHCVVVEGLAQRPGRGEELVWGVLSAMDLVRAAAGGELDGQAGDLAATEVVTVQDDESMQRAIQAMSEHEVTHLIVIASSGEPIGVLSSLDFARFLSDSEEGRSLHESPQQQEEVRHG